MERRHRRQSDHEFSRFCVPLFDSDGPRKQILSALLDLDVVGSRSGPGSMPDEIKCDQKLKEDVTQELVLPYEGLSYVWG
ncbi:hypothetical protein GMOD_00008660 [Pyrenophora seminiperda CCB06]|uniref:Uncharacterized protein n=1 Tax=Pyrenophora seminiperda CCB06 TaxID=1302712 RepID=A0A3M7M8Z8_9PLEO|nr:hypothetical protein GMOD_00008660 [Pyrenophora seminiperda CCB06]